jgi:spore coat protein CotH
VEVIFNGQYAGSYVLTEQVQVGKGRVDIDKNRGFLVELDRRYDDDPKFRTDILGLPVMIKSPEDSGYDFVKDAINELEAAIFSPEFPENGYRELINVNSFIDYLLINDMLMNWELQVPSSVFMYKDKDEKISMGPLWDFDGGFGYEDDGKTFFTRIEERIPFSSMRAGQGGRFFQRFFEDPYFREKYKNRWNEKYADIAAMEAFIDQMAEALDKSQEMNYKVWWWKKVNYKDEIEKMKIWWRARIDYLNTEINK